MRCEELRAVKNMTLRESSTASALMPRAAVVISHSKAAEISR